MIVWKNENSDLNRGIHFKTYKREGWWHVVNKVRIRFVSFRENQVFLTTFEQKARMFGWETDNLNRLDGIREVGLFKTFLAREELLAYSEITNEKDLHVCESYWKIENELLFIVQFLGIRDRRNCGVDDRDELHCLFLVNIEDGSENLPLSWSRYGGPDEYPALQELFNSFSDEMI